MSIIRLRPHPQNSPFHHRLRFLLAFLQILLGRILFEEDILLLDSNPLLVPLAAFLDTYAARQGLDVVLVSTMAIHDGVAIGVGAAIDL